MLEDLGSVVNPGCGREGGPYFVPLLGLLFCVQILGFIQSPVDFIRNPIVTQLEASSFPCFHSLFGNIVWAFLLRPSYDCHLMTSSCLVVKFMLIIISFHSTFHFSVYFLFPFVKMGEGLPLYCLKLLLLFFIYLTFNIDFALYIFFMFYRNKVQLEAGLFDYLLPHFSIDHSLLFSSIPCRSSSDCPQHRHQHQDSSSYLHLQA